jgi:rhamnose transport system permease protein
VKERSLRTLLTRHREYGVLALLLVVVLLVSLVNPSFLAAKNLSDLLIKAAPIAIVACGMTFIIIVGEIDISVGSMMGLLAAILGVSCSTSQAGLPVSIAIPLVLLAGTVLGGINGLLVTVGRVPSIIVTLGMLTLLKGITEIVMHGEWIKDLPPDLRWFGTGAVVGIPVPVLTAVLTFAFCLLVARETPLGRRLYAVGGNPDAARLLGLRVLPMKWSAFALTGFLTAVATIISVPQLSVIESGIGQGFELLVITCVVVGGTSIRGGRGNLTGTLFAVLLLSMIGTVLIFLRLGEMATYWERAIQGAFILLAVLADHYSRRSRKAGGAA